MTHGGSVARRTVLVTGAAGLIGSSTYFVADGASANRYRFADLAETSRALGYVPLDDAWAGR